MARISIKKNFIDGEKLFAQQLNNNFKTIEEAVNDGNKIVWQDGTEVKFKRYVTNSIDELPIMDGSIIYDTEKGRHYIDYEGRRIQVGSAGKEVLVQEEQPTEEDNKIWIESDVVNSMGTEILNVKSNSKIMGYSANYLNDRIVNVSPTEPTSGEKVWLQKSNNLMPMNIETQTKNGVTFTNNGDGTFNLNGTATADTEFDAYFFVNQLDIISGKDYVMSLNEQPFMAVQLVLYNGYGDWVATPVLIKGTETVKAGTINIDASVDKVRLLITVISGTKYNSNNIKFQLEQGTTPTVWQPYVTKKIHTKNANDVYDEFYKQREIAVVDISLETGSGTASFPQGFTPENSIIIGHIDRNKWNMPFGNVKEVETIINGDDRTIVAAGIGNFSGGTARTSIVLMKLF